MRVFCSSSDGAGGKVSEKSMWKGVKAMLWRGARIWFAFAIVLAGILLAHAVGGRDTSYAIATRLGFTMVSCPATASPGSIENWSMCGVMNSSGLGTSVSNVKERLMS